MNEESPRSTGDAVRLPPQLQCRRRVVSFPRPGAAAANPFLVLMAQALERLSYQVEPFSFAGAVQRRYDAAILHWPDHFSTMFPWPRACVRTFAFLAFLWLQKRRGARIIRIVHDATELSSKHPRLRRINRQLCAHLTTHYVYLSESSRRAFAARFPKQMSKPSITLFHPTYGATMSPVPHVVARSATTLRFVGDVNRYKGLHRFLDLATETATLLRLHIVGRCRDQKYAERVETAMERARASGSEIDWDARRPDDDELEELIRTSRAVALPYLDGWNSGMAIKVLEQRVPLLCSDLPIFRELAEEVGPAWVTCYAADGSDFARCVAAGAGVRDTAAHARLDAYLAPLTWDRFAAGLKKVLSE